MHPPGVALWVMQVSTVRRFSLEVLHRVMQRMLPSSMAMKMPSGLPSQKTSKMCARDAATDSSGAQGSLPHQHTIRGLTQS